MRVRFQGFPWVGDGSYSDTFETWSPGETKNIGDAEAARLVSSFSNYFTLVLEKEAEAVIAGDLPGEGIDTVRIKEIDFGPIDEPIKEPTKKLKTTKVE